MLNQEDIKPMCYGSETVTPKGIFRAVHFYDSGSTVCRCGQDRRSQELVSRMEGIRMDPRP